MPKKLKPKPTAVDIPDFVRFAADVLSILEDNTEWNSDTLDEIAIAADRHGLSVKSDDGLFKARFSYTNAYHLADTE